MRPYAAAFLSEADAVAAMGEVPDDQPLSNATAGLLYQHIEVHTDKQSQFLWSRLDRLAYKYHKIFIDNVPASMTTRELMNAFSRCGKVVCCEIFRGLSNRPLHIATAADGTEGIAPPGTLSRKQLKYLLSNPDSRVVDTSKTADAFIYFKSKASADRAISPGMRIFGVSIHDVVVKPQPVSRKNVLVLHGLRRRMTSSDVEYEVRSIIDGFLPQEALVSVRIPAQVQDRNRGMAMATFDSHESAMEAFRALDDANYMWPRDTSDQAWTPGKFHCTWGDTRSSLVRPPHMSLPLFPDAPVANPPPEVEEEEAAAE
jgi:hypothetical protein